MKLLVFIAISCAGFSASAGLMDIINASLVEEDAKGYFIRDSDDDRIAIDDAKVCLGAKISHDGVYMLASPQPAGVSNSGSSVAVTRRTSRRSFSAAIVFCSAANCRSINGQNSGSGQRV